MRVLKFCLLLSSGAQEEPALECPACGAGVSAQASLGGVTPELVRGDHSIELYLLQCDECEVFWLVVYDDFPGA